MLTQQRSLRPCQRLKILTARLWGANQETTWNNCKFESRATLEKTLTTAFQYKHAHMFWKHLCGFPRLHAIHMRAIVPSNCTICFMVWDTPWSLNKKTWGEGSRGFALLTTVKLGTNRLKKYSSFVCGVVVAAETIQRLDVSESAKQTCLYLARHLKKKLYIYIYPVGLIRRPFSNKIAADKEPAKSW